MTIYYSFRNSTVNNVELLDLIYAENMQHYVEQIYFWQPELFKSSFVAKDYQVIEYSDVIIGFIKTVASQTSIYLAEIQVRNGYKNRGVGSDIINKLIDWAIASKRRLWLKVLINNPALNLYQRLGFTVFEQTATHFKLELEAQTDH